LPHRAYAQPLKQNIVSDEERRVFLSVNCPGLKARQLSPADQLAEQAFAALEAGIVLHAAAPNRRVARAQQAPSHQRLQDFFRG
jgi:hypothetical protein